MERERKKTGKALYAVLGVFCWSLQIK